MARSVNVSAAGEFLANGTATQSKRLVGARLTAATGVIATMTVKETDVSGRILYSLAAPIDGADECQIPVDYIGKVFVTITSGAIGHVFEP